MSTIFIFAVILVTTAVATAYLYMKYVFLHWKRRGVPFLEPTFPFGNFKDMILQRLSLSDMVTTLYNKSSDALVGVYVTVHPSLIVRDPKLLRDILIKDFQHFTYRGANIMEDVDPMTNNLMMQNGEKWKDNRSKMTPAFSTGKLKGMIGVILNCAQPLSKYMEQYTQTGETIEMREVLARFSVSVLAAVAFGININPIENPDEEFRYFGRKFFALTPRNMLRLNLTFIYPKLVKLLRLRFADKDVCDFITSTVKQNLDYRVKMNDLERTDFFQILMKIRNDQSGKSIMSVDEMSAHALIFFVAGFESAAATMSYCMYEMSRKPEIQRRAQQEIDAVLKQYDGKLTYESIAEMKYVDRCVDETLRLHPAFGTIARECTKDYKIADTNIVIQKGTSLIVPIAAIHRDGKYYEQPDEFIPERFDDKATANKTFLDMPYLPFGDGPRICIGLRLAKLEAKVGIICMLKDYSFELGPQHINKELKSYPTSIAKFAVGGINLKVKSRFNNFA
ncbi:putative cytochrome P450 6a14 [Pseudolycoriella hygida]|uniref:Cytochrome P450 6a14 n=1 Tax=Pseudolycoriella hygida TaxID=35572 RepID=A0A9Q0NGD2_9DIPT|nr:putative cytochrome P450 6a14 [Pseudolycoriella hygida]